MAEATVERPVASRPLSEISENGDHQSRRGGARISSYSSSLSLKGTSANPTASSGERDRGTGEPQQRFALRPASEVRDGKDQPTSKRISSEVPVHTITLNLADYTGTAATPSLASKTTAVTVSRPPTPVSPVSPDGPSATSAPVSPQSPSTPVTPPPQSPTNCGFPVASTATADSPKAAPPKPEKPAELSARPIAIPLVTMVPLAGGDVIDLSDPSEELEPEHAASVDTGLSPLLMATRAALRPSPLGGNNLSKEDSPTQSTSNASPRSSLDASKSSSYRSKTKWLKRASMGPSLRPNRSRSPAASSTDLPGDYHTSTTAPSPRINPSLISAPIQVSAPPLPPRKFPSGPMDPPLSPSGISASRPTPVPSRETSGSSHHHSSMTKSRWGRSAQTSTSSTGGGAPVSRSSSNNSIASAASAVHQRLPSGAQRALGHAGTALQWMRARGGSSMSISGISAIANAPPSRSHEHSIAHTHGGHSLTRRASRDLLDELQPASTGTLDLPEWPQGVVKRRARGALVGRVFGRDITEVGRTWGVFDAGMERPEDNEYQRRRRRCVPAIVVRTVEYLSMWGPTEEGIIRVNGRSSHILRLRREFDAGADLDLTMCEPSDLDPHAVAGVFKSYLRELPLPMLPPTLSAEIQEYMRSRYDPSDVSDLATMLGQLPTSHWFLLADVIMLIDMIPRHASVNRMTHGALMTSLGPSLQLSGDLVSLFVKHRSSLFTSPPDIAATDLIDFGDDAELTLTPPSFEQVPLPATTPPQVSMLSGKAPRPRLNKKPSLGKILGNSLSSMRKSQSDVVLSHSHSSSGTHISSASPGLVPRLALPDQINMDLPSFGAPPDIDECEELNSAEMHEAVGVRSNDKVVERHYAPGTVKARAAVFSSDAASTASTQTPIADRFRRDSSVDLLRCEKGAGSMCSDGTNASDSSLAAMSEFAVTSAQQTALRRSPPVYFQSAAMQMADFSSSLSGSPSSVSTSLTGRKRKDEASVERDSAKRLSAGPGLQEFIDDALMQKA